MATKDLHNIVNYVQGLYSQVITAAKTADNSANMQGYESAEFAFLIGAVSGTTPTATLLIEESADNSTFTTVAAADLIGGALPVLDGTQNIVVKRGYRGILQYVRARVSAMTGTTPSYAIGCVITQSHPRHLPTPSTT
jgi:hypothetical protein